MTTISDDAQMRVGNQLFAAKKPNRKKGRVTAQTRVNLLFLVRTDEVGVVVDEYDDE